MTRAIIFNLDDLYVYDNLAAAAAAQLPKESYGFLRGPPFLGVNKHHGQCVQGLGNQK